MGPAQPKPTRKRNRKRKRRVVSDPSSSEELSSSDSGASTPQRTVTIPVRQSKLVAPENTDADEDDDDDESSSFDESQDDDNNASDEEVVDESLPSSKPGPQPAPHRDSPSPPPNVDVPPFIPKNAPESEQALKEKFRKFWMASIAEGFRDDLEEIRKEPSLVPSRLALLIESLASGADVFSSSSVAGGVNEMEVVLDQLS